MGIVNHAPLLETLILKPTVDEDKIGKGSLPSMLWAGSPNFRKLVVVLSVPDEDEHGDSLPYAECSTWPTSNHIPYEQITHLRLDAYAYDIFSCEEVISIFSCEEVISIFSCEEVISIFSCEEVISIFSCEEVISIFSCEEVISIFKRAANLVCCFIEGISDFDHSLSTQDHTPILLIHLRHLCLESTYNGAFVSQPLQFITAPALVSLTLVGPSAFHFSVYEAFIQRSSCALEELNFLYTDIGIHTTLASMGLVTSSLRRLHVGNYKVSSPSEEDEFLSSMTRWDPATNTFLLCPNLEQVSVRLSYVNTFGRKDFPELALIIQILESRMQLQRPTGGSGNMLKTLLIPSRWDAPAQASSKLQALCVKSHWA